MKVFFIFRDSDEKGRNIATLMSAFASIESIGQADDMLDAIEAIQNRYPEAVVSDERILERTSELFSTLFDGVKGPLVIVSEDYRVREKSIYIGLEFSSADSLNFEWIIRSIRTVIEEYHGKTAD